MANDTIVKNKKINFFMQSNYIYDWKLSEFLNGNDICVYGYLTRLANNNVNIFPTLKTIYECCCIGRTTAQNCLNNLLKLGLIDKKARFNDSNLYVVYDVDEVFEKINEKVIKKSNIKKSSLSVVDEVSNKNGIETCESIPLDAQHQTKNSIADIEKFFNEVWYKLPSKMKKGKTAVKQTRRKELYKVGSEILNNCLDLYLIDVKKEKKENFMLNGSTWFNGRYEDYISLAKETKIIKQGENKINISDMIWGD